MKKQKIIAILICLLVIGIGGMGLFLWENTANHADIPMEDLHQMVIASEMPYPIYANSKYCIIVMQQAGVVIYNFAEQKTVDRITHDMLKEAGFLFPVASVSKDGKTVYFAEDTMDQPIKITYEYNLKKKQLCKTNDTVNWFNHHKELNEKEMSDGLFFDNGVYSHSYIELNSKILTVRLKENGFLLSDMEIVLLSPDGTPEMVYPIIPEQS